MRKYTRILCLLLAMSLLMAVPAQATANVEPRGSIFFSSYLTYLSKVSSTSLGICFDVTANAAFMDELGASEIELFESSDQTNWTSVKTYEPEDYPVMLDYNTTSHAGYVMYYEAKPGYYYTACVTYYAKDSRGVGETLIYTDILKM